MKLIVDTHNLSEHMGMIKQKLKIGDYIKDDDRLNKAFWIGKITEIRIYESGKGEILYKVVYTNSKKMSYQTRGKELCTVRDCKIYKLTEDEAMSWLI